MTLPALQHQVLRTLYFVLLLLPGFSAAAQSNPWILKNEKDLVKVYYRRTEGVHEVKLATSIQSSMSDLVHLMHEVTDYPKWGYKVTESRVVKKISDTDMYYHSKLDFPWPMDDRDIVMHTVMHQDPVTKVITATSVAEPDAIPEVPGFMRIRQSTTKWTIMPGQNGWLYVEYYINSSPGGNIPDWMVNAAIDVGPRETIKGIRNMLAQPKYRNKQLAYIRD